METPRDPSMMPCQTKHRSASGQGQTFASVILPGLAVASRAQYIADTEDDGIECS